IRLCTICILCTHCLPLPKRALLPAEPPPNRLQISDRAAALPETICADSQEENKGKPRENILTASPSLRKVAPRVSRACDLPPIFSPRIMRLFPASHTYVNSQQRAANPSRLSCPDNWIWL